MANSPSNSTLERILNKELDFSSDTHKIILMASGFVFNPATHNNYSDVSASELPTANGYTVGGATLSGATVAVDTGLPGAACTWNNATWNISGGNLTSSSAIIINDTHANDAIIQYIDFGGDQTTLDGGIATVANPQFRLKR